MGLQFTVALGTCELFDLLLNKCLEMIFQDSSSSVVVLSFNKDGMTDKLKLSLPDYAAVMADCLKGEYIFY